MASRVIKIAVLWRVGGEDLAMNCLEFIESAGAKVTFIPHTDFKAKDCEEFIAAKGAKELDRANGVIFPGGSGIKDEEYFKAVKGIFEYFKRRNAAGSHFPAFGICLGLQHLAMIVGGVGIDERSHILGDFEAREPSTLEFRLEDHEETVFESFPSGLLEKMGNHELVNQNHGHGVSPDKFEGVKKLRDFFEILTTSTDRNGKAYVSTARARLCSLTLFQWHPEQPAKTTDVAHQEDANEVTQLVANFLVNEAKKSLNHTYICSEAKKSLNQTAGSKNVGESS